MFFIGVFSRLSGGDAASAKSISEKYFGEAEARDFGFANHIPRAKYLTLREPFERRVLPLIESCGPGRVDAPRLRRYGREKSHHT